MTAPTAPAHFDALYAADPDPWRFASSPYERDKYAATLAALPPRRFRRGMEAGCSIGVLSRQLAARCDAFLGLDVAAAAVARARQDGAAPPGLRFEQAHLPQDWPGGRFDLVVFSEVLYYLGDAGLTATAARTRASLAPGGLVLLVNWLGDTGTGTTGSAAADAFIAAAGLPARAVARTDSYRLDLLTAAGSSPPG